MKKKRSYDEISHFFEIDYSTEYYDSLLLKNKEESFVILQKLYDFFNENNQVLVVQAKDIFYKFRHYCLLSRHQ